jgi:hypothetical protein
MKRILKAIREKNQITFKDEPIKIIADFSTKTLKARRAWSEVFLFFSMEEIDIYFMIILGKGKLDSK